MPDHSPVFAASVSVSRHRSVVILVTLGLLAVAVILLACLVGSVSVSIVDLAGALMDLLRGAPSTLASTLLELRLGRALSAFVTGSALALAGVMMQALLRNPLADPYVLGVSGGAAVGALTAMLF
ncbi:MAG: iron chelate uptake ABC transporter family permease subunit, partial [Burkholderiaceae bacterium]